MTIHNAFMPYYLMTYITLIVLLISPINNLLSKFSYGPNFIQTETDFGIVNTMVTKFSPIKLFTHASDFLFTSAIGTAVAPGNIVLGTTKAGILGSEGKVLRKIIPFALSVAGLFGLLLFIYHIL